MVGIAGLAVANNSDYTKAFERGTPNIQSISQIEFGPEGILFVGDAMTASIVAISTEDNSPSSVESVQLKEADKKIAAFLGATVEQIRITDMAVNPISKSVYFSVNRDNQSVLIKLTGEKLEEFTMADVLYSSITLNNPVSTEAERRGRKLRRLAITDLAFKDDKLFVAGLSNEEFSSAFRAIPFPFKEDQSFSTLEIFHVSHGKYETHAPVTAFEPYEFEDGLELIAGYTCTPLVTFPVSQMKNGQHVKGKTVAELGNRNMPVEILAYQRDGEDFILIANSKRNVMRVRPADIAAQKSLTEPLKERHGTVGVDFAAIAEVYVQQMDNLDKNNVVFLQLMPNGNLDLRTVKTSRL